MDIFPEDAKFVLTPEFLLYKTISEYGVDLDEWAPKLWQHIFEDFMSRLERMGYIEKKLDKEE